MTWVRFWACAVLLAGCRTPPGAKLRFWQAQRIDTGPQVAALAEGDFDGDGRGDALLAADQAGVWRGTAARTLAPLPPLGHPGGYDHPLTGDLDGDGRLDV